MACPWWAIRWKHMWRRQREPATPRRCSICLAPSTSSAHCAPLRILAPVVAYAPALCGERQSLRRSTRLRSCSLRCAPWRRAARMAAFYGRQSGRKRSFHWRRSQRREGVEASVPPAHPDSRMHRLFASSTGVGSQHGTTSSGAVLPSDHVPHTVHSRKGRSCDLFLREDADLLGDRSRISNTAYIWV